MAELNFKINVGGNANESVGSLKKQLREAQAEVVKLSDKFGATSEQAVNAAKKAADLRDRIGDAKALTDAFNPDAKFRALSQSLSSVAGGFTAVQGAIGLFGAESKDVEKTLLKVQSALALSQGLEQIGGLADAFKNLKAVAVNAFNGIKAAIGSTGIGLLVVALGTIYAYWDDIKAAISGVSEEQKKLNKSTQENLKAKQDELDIINKSEAILKLQGKTEKEILQIQISKTKEAITFAKLNLENAIKTAEVQNYTAKRNKEIFQGILNTVSTGILVLLKGIDTIGSAFGKNFKLYEQFTSGIANKFFNPEETKAEGEATIKEAKKTLLELENNYAQYQLNLQEIDKDAADKQAELTQKEIEAAIERYKKLLELEQKRRDQVLDVEKQIRAVKQETDKIGLSEKDKRILEAEQELNNNLRLYSDNLDARLKAYILYDERIKAANKKTKLEESEQEKKDTEDFYERLTKRAEAQINQIHAVKVEGHVVKATEEEKQMAYQATGNAFGALSDLIGRQTAAGKALAVGQALINTYLGVTEVLRNKTTIPEPFGTIQKVASVATILASGISAVTRIKNTQIPGGGGGGSVPSFSAAAPVQPQQPQAQMTQLNAQTINALGNQAIKAYVVETDVTSNQQRIKAIQQRARFD